jgi:hypothetical protein
MADVFTGEPGVEVGLPACGQCASAAAQPVEQADRRANSSADQVELAVGGVGTAVALPEPPEHVPDRVSVQQFLLVRLGVLVEGVGDPPFDPREVLVTGGQCCGGHQDAAQMLDRLAGCQIVERGLAQWSLPAGEVGEHRADRGVLEPGQCGARPVDARQRLV